MPSTKRSYSSESEDENQGEERDPEMDIEDEKTSAEDGASTTKGDPNNLSQRYIFKNLHLKVIIRENHERPIYALCLNRTRKDLTNMVATVGGDQANVYNNANMGNNLDLVLHFINEKTEKAKKSMVEASSDLHCCTWMSASGGEGELKDDAYLAVAGNDMLIHVMSVKRAKVIAQLAGHTSEIVYLEANPVFPHLLLSVGGKDGTLRLWDILAEDPNICTWHQVNLRSATFSPNGTIMLCGSQKGELIERTVPTFAFSRAPRSGPDLKKQKTSSSSSAASASASSSTSTVIDLLRGHSSPIDCVRYIAHNKAISKSYDGKVIVFDPQWHEVYGTFEVGKGDKSSASHFDISPDGKFFCVGNSTGHVHIISLESYKLVRRIKHRRSTQPIRACAFTEDMRSVLYVSDDSNIWRYDFIHPDTPSLSGAIEAETKDTAA